MLAPTTRLLVCLLPLACAPHITNFAAQPQFVCSGMPTTLKWETVGDPTLFTQSDRSDPAPIPSSGERQFTLDRTTTFTMSVNRSGKTVEARQEVTYLETSHAQRIQVDPKSCDEGAVIFESEVPAARWPRLVQVAAIDVTAPLANDLIIEHGARAATIAHGETSTAALGGTPITGPWRATLKTTRCEDAPDALVFSTTLSCSP